MYQGASRSTLKISSHQKRVSCTTFNSSHISIRASIMLWYHIAEGNSSRITRGVSLEPGENEQKGHEKFWRTEFHCLKARNLTFKFIFFSLFVVPTMFYRLCFLHLFPLVLFHFVRIDHEPVEGHPTKEVVGWLLLLAIARLGAVQGVVKYWWTGWAGGPWGIFLMYKWLDEIQRIPGEQENKWWDKCRFAHITPFCKSLHAPKICKFPGREI